MSDTGEIADERQWRKLREQHNRVSRAEGQIVDSAGSIGDPLIAEGLLGKLERNGDITAQDRQAGDRFAELFHRAHLSPIRAADMSRVSHASGACEAFGNERARREIIDAMTALGGMGSPMGSAAWLVIGCDLSIREWAAREAWRGRPADQRVAKGVLIAALDALARHWGIS